MPIKADKSLRAYYNEIDKNAAQWLRNLMAEGWITKGDVDERSIEDVQPNDLAGYDRLHFFAGVAVWDYALNQAGWGRGEVWTGSCPCQPFSAAGKGAGFDDERHLWPAFQHLIKECKPAIVFGEQVASKDSGPWIDLVHADMEALGYAFGAIPFPSAGVGAPHIRDRLYWVADAGQHDCGPQAATANRRKSEANRPANRVGGCGVLAGWMADNIMQQRPHGQGRFCNVDEARGRNESAAAITGLCCDSRMADTDSNGLSARNRIRLHGQEHDAEHGSRQGNEHASPTNGFWRDADWLLCRDGKWRPVEPGTFPLASGIAARVVRLRAYGNSIAAPAASAFISSVMESINGI